MAFPYDDLKCLFDLGGWFYGADVQGVIAKPCTGSSCGEGWELSNQEPTSGESYQEMSIGTIEAVKTDFMYSCWCAASVLTRTHRFTRDASPRLISSAPLCTRLYGHHHSPTPFPVITYTITLKRASSYYIKALLFPNFFLVMLAFSVFFTGNEVSTQRLKPWTSCLPRGQQGCLRSDESTL